MKHTTYKHLLNALLLKVAVFASITTYAAEEVTQVASLAKQGDAPVLVVYRLDDSYQDALTTYVDGHVVGSLPPSTYAQTSICDGSFNLTLKDNPNDINVKGAQSFVAKQGSTTYVKVAVSSDGRYLSQQVTSTQAGNDLKNIKNNSHLISRLPTVCKKPARAINLGVDALFAFNSADLLPTGAVQLNSFVSEFKEQMPQVSALRITGHTDSLGEAGYNEKLSLARASSIAKYLELAGVGVPLAVEGRGEREPVSRGCDRFAQDRASMITCLQPDRRVVIELIDRN